MIRVYVRHRGCWSTILSRYPDVVGELLSQNVVGKIVEGNIIFFSKMFLSEGFAWQFLSEIRNHPIVKEARFLQTFDNGRMVLMNIRASSLNSFSNLVYSMGSPLFKEFFCLGNELWYLLYPKENISELKKAIAGISGILDFRRLNDQDYMLLFSFCYPVLKPSYDTITRFILNSGYFERTHNLTMAEIADKFDVSKTVVARKIRIIEKTLLSNYVRRLDVLPMTRNKFEKEIGSNRC